MADTTVGFEFDRCPEGFAPPLREDESALVLDLRSGIESAYEKLILRFEQPVYNIVSRLLDNPGDAADVVQEVFLKIFRNIGSFRQDSSLKTWIYRIAVNEARNHRRWFSRHRRQEIGLETDVHGESTERAPNEWLPDPGRSPFELALDRETQELIEAALLEVNPKFRAALVLREIEGLSYEEIAEVLDVSLGTVKSRILRGRDALKKCLAERLEPNSAGEWSAQLAE
ncbi:MAG TPA: sigma-70 family RNA polymerase sigma factor [Bryobacteraceae bacterium]|jgi:RNA polymerase sigma-70 factor (ECF subfamily)|nr:sigma-70 family RNA polymerase sigma factor [Bryobacteraceae bacterium]